MLRRPTLRQIPSHSTSAISSAMARMTTDRAQPPNWLLQKHSPPVRNQSARSSSSGIPEKSRAFTDHATMPTSRWCLSTRSRPSSIWTWSAATTAMTSRVITPTPCSLWADRISTDLHNIIIQTNNGLANPLRLDYEMNDINDPESVYTRSDHYSYAQKGIPIAFFTTGLHPDYHRVTDSVDKIVFPKMARIAQLVYETGFGIANTDKVLERDNKGPRSGFGSKAEVIKK